MSDLLAGARHQVRRRRPRITSPASRPAAASIVGLDPKGTAETLIWGVERSLYIFATTGGRPASEVVESLVPSLAARALPPPASSYSRAQSAGPPDGLEPAPVQLGPLGLAQARLVAWPPRATSRRPRPGSRRRSRCRPDRRRPAPSSPRSPGRSRARRARLPGTASASGLRRRRRRRAERSAARPRPAPGRRTASTRLIGDRLERGPGDLLATGAAGQSDDRAPRVGIPPGGAEPGQRRHEVDAVVARRGRRRSPRVSAASAISPRPSRSHWIAAPVTNTAASSA